MRGGGERRRGREQRLPRATVVKCIGVAPDVIILVPIATQSLWQLNVHPWYLLLRLFYVTLTGHSSWPIHMPVLWVSYIHGRLKS